jgi:hypothetical protein
MLLWLRLYWANCEQLPLKYMMIKPAEKTFLANLADNGFTVFTRAETTFGIKR